MTILSNYRGNAALGCLAAVAIAWPGLANSYSEVQRLQDQAKRYEHGVGAPQNLDQAVSLYCQASALGDAHSKYEIGWLYLTGRMGKVDQVLAAAWFQFAAKDKHPQAIERLSELGALDLELDQRPECILKASLEERYLPLRESRDAPSSPAEQAPSDVVIREPGRADIVALVQRLAPEYGLDPALVLAVIEVESNFNPSARSNKDAQGLMQLIPATAERFHVANVWEPVSNLRGGMAYLKWLLANFNGDIELALAGYNAGENAVARHGGIPPFAETQAYVKRVKAIYAARSSTAASQRPTRAAARVETPGSPKMLTVGDSSLADAH